MPQKYSIPVYKHEVPWQVYDLLILAGLVGSLYLSIAVSAVFLAFLVVLIYGSFIEPRLLTVKEFEVGEGDKELKIVFLTDPHLGPYKRSGWMKRVVERTNQLKPDVVILGGDLIYNRERDVEYIEPLTKLQARYQVAAILGNHGFYYCPEKIIEQLKKIGLPPLRNESVSFEHEGRRIVLAGVDDDWHAETDLAKATADARSEDALIMILHNPDLAPPAVKFHPALMLSGHTHGGQIRLPFIGPVPKLPHHLGRRYDRGYFEITSSENSNETAPLIISQGIGESGPRVRLFCPPEITVIRLRC